MNRFLLSAALATAIAVSTGSVATAGKGGGHGGGHGGGSMASRSSGSMSMRSNSHHFNSSRMHVNGNFRNYCTTYGTRFAGGYYYQGNCHNQWSSYCWNRNFNCYTYWCPSSLSYYYWYAPLSCYYPVSYITYARPTTVCAPAVAAVPVAGAAVTGSSYTVPVNVQVASRVSQGPIVANGGGVAQPGPNGPIASADPMTPPPAP